ATSRGDALAGRELMPHGSVDAGPPLALAATVGVSQRTHLGEVNGQGVGVNVYVITFCGHLPGPGSKGASDRRRRQDGLYGSMQSGSVTRLHDEPGFTVSNDTAQFGGLCHNYCLPHGHRLEQGGDSRWHGAFDHGDDHNLCLEVKLS